MKFKNKRIAGLLAILPETESLFDDEVDNFDFPQKQSSRLKTVMGFGKHRLTKMTSNTSDYCIYGLNYLFENNLIKKDEIGAIIVVTASPDYYLPHVSNIVHGECDLPEDVVCMDIPQGCCGFLLGLMQAFFLLEHLENKKVLVFNADVLSKKVVRSNRNNFPLAGDATTVTVIENEENGEEIYFDIRNDGKQREALIIPAGGFKLPSSEETARLVKLEDGNYINQDTILMDGTAVFNFVQKNVPPIIETILCEHNLEKDDIDWYLFHQPNKFMLRKLADKLKIPYEKMPMDLVENFGNSGGATIPMVIAHTLRDRICNEKYMCCFSAFGSGLSWGAMLMKIGYFDFCKMIESNL